MCVELVNKIKQSKFANNALIRNCIKIIIISQLLRMITVNAGWLISLRIYVAGMLK